MVVLVVGGDEVVLMTARPDEETAYHVPPKADTPSPFVCPARLSSENMYSGWRLYVACKAPPARRVVPSIDTFTCAPAVGLRCTIKGGQNVAHFPVHALLP